MSALLAVERMQVMGDPTNTQNVWIAGYTNTDVNQITMRLLPYLWALVVVGMILAGSCSSNLPLIGLGTGRQALSPHPVKDVS